MIESGTIPTEIYVLAFVLLVSLLARRPAHFPVAVRIRNKKR
jgi:hypothetical protein